LAEITALLVKELREKTGAGMMDCKKALAENEGQLEAAVDWLRTKGLSAAAKKAGRVACEGLVGLAIDGNRGALIEINAETDFVARNDIFQAFVQTMARLVLDHGSDLEKLGDIAYPETGRKVSEQLTHMISTIGENIRFRRAVEISVDNGCLSSYIHNALASNVGKIGVIIAVKSVGNVDKLGELGRQLAMHIAATKPQAILQTDLDPKVVERERTILADQARQSGKPEEIIDKMVDGRLRKFFEDVCLVDQTFVIDGETKVAMVIENASQEIGGEVKIDGFEFFVLGEGIEKKQEDFAAEVATVATS